jgi:hypothetical protein
MTTFESFRKGGRNDDPIAPGKPKDSYLIEVLTATDVSRMPPPDVASALPKEKIDIISEWIKQGAKLDKSIETTANLRNELRKRWQPPALLASYQRPALITAVAFTPDNKQLITTGYHELLVWDAATGKLAKRLHTRAERAHELRFLKDGTLAVAGGRPGQEGDVRGASYAWPAPARSAALSPACSAAFSMAPQAPRKARHWAAPRRLLC